MNPMELLRLNNDGMQALREGRLETARRCLEQACQGAGSHPPHVVAAAYALATLHWGDYGNGVEAKTKFEVVMEIGKKALSRRDDAAGNEAISIHLSCAAENLMLLSTSYEEFDKWTAELRGLAPDEPILAQLVPVTKASHDRGVPWVEVMRDRGLNYINIGHFGASIHPASGACILHLMLEHRKALRMRQDIWQQALMGYHATVCEICYKAEKLMKSHSGYRVQELAGVKQFLWSFTKEYNVTHPGDDLGKQLLDNATKLKEQLEQRPSRMVPPQNPPGESKRSFLSRNGWLWVVRLAFGLIVGTAAFFLLPLNPAVESHRALYSLLIGGAAFVAFSPRSFMGPFPRPWVTSSVVNEEVERRRWKGLTFQLERVQADENAHLHLFFRFFTKVPDEKCGVHMAIRSIVALTLPHVVVAIPELVIVEEKAGYTIGCGSGVNIPFYTIRGQEASIDLLQVGSEMEGRKCHVWIHPTVLSTSSPQKSAAQRKIQSQIGQMFMRMFRPVPVCL